MPIALRRIVSRVRPKKEKSREIRIAKPVIVREIKEITEDELEKDIYIAIELGFTA